MTGIGFPHSEIPGSKRVCRYPRLIAAYHVLHRLLVPRHPPCALLRLTKIEPPIPLAQDDGKTWSLSRLAPRFRPSEDRPIHEAASCFTRLYAVVKEQEKNSDQ